VGLVPVVEPLFMPVVLPVQGIERGVWKWSASVKGVLVMGERPTRSWAVAAAEKSIDRALVIKQVRPVPRYSPMMNRSNLLGLMNI